MKRTVVIGWGCAFSPFHAWAGELIRRMPPYLVAAPVLSSTMFILC